MNLFYEVFGELERLAPGSEESTLRALQGIRQILEPMDILEIGCGTGAQTLVLAQNTRAQITSLDNHSGYLRALEQKLRILQLSDRVTTVEASMLEPFCSWDPHDVIWAEGCIYIIGLENALLQWRDLIRDQGILAFSEATWLMNSPSREPREFWAGAYPAMRTLEENCRIVEDLGFVVREHFVLPHSDWEQYYEPLKARMKVVKPRFLRNRQAQKFFLGLQQEIKLYERYGHEYGYVFYILQKV